MFGLFKKKAPTVEEQVETLKAHGFVFPSHFSVNKMLDEWPRAELEKNPYMLVLIYLGDEYEDPATGQWEPRSKQIWHFDFECIEDNGAYVQIAQRMVDLTSGTLPLTDITDEVDVEEEKAVLRFNYNGKPYELVAKVDNDWADPAILRQLSGLANANNPDKRFTYLAMGQDCLIGYASETERQKLNAATGLNFQWLDGATL